LDFRYRDFQANRAPIVLENTRVAASKRRSGSAHHRPFRDS
jgi:hypothetical protein